MNKKRKHCSSLDRDLKQTVDQLAHFRTEDGALDDGKLAHHFPSFQQIIQPLKLAQFFSTYWETKHVHCQKQQEQSSGEANYGFDFKLDDLWQLVQQHDLQYGLHLNVCSCKDGKKQLMHNQQGKVNLEALKDFWNTEKATIQLFHPQCYQDDIYKVLQKLEDEFEIGRAHV